MEKKGGPWDSLRVSEIAPQIPKAFLEIAGAPSRNEIEKAAEKYLHSLKH